MDTSAWLLVGIFVIGLVALLGFFVTKSKGFGRFSTSTLLLLLVVVVSTLLYAADKLEGVYLANLYFAIVGFAGGLFTAKETSDQAAKS